MADERGSIQTRASTTGPINWFANVVRVDGRPSAETIEVEPDARSHEEIGPEPVEVAGRPSLLVIGVLLVAAAAILLAGGFLLINDRLDDDGGGSRASDGSAGTGFEGSFDRPYPFGLNVTLSYNDLTLAQSREWRIQLLESTVDDDRLLAMARVRLTYQEGSSPGPVDDLVFHAVDRSGTAYPSETEGCNPGDGGLEQVELGPGRAVEGWLCWPVPNDDLSSLVMAVEAEPADGVLYMVLADGTAPANDTAPAKDTAPDDEIVPVDDAGAGRR